jgi:hypothetical protein
MAKKFEGTPSNDTLSGSWGDDLIDGAGGADVMTGGAGNDVYIVDNINDIVREVPDYSVNTETLIALASTSVKNVPGNSDSGNQATAISGNGELVAFFSRASNLLTSDANLFNPDIDVKNMTTGSLSNAHTTSANLQPTSGQGGGPQSDYSQMQMTSDGKYLVYASTSVGLMPGVDDLTDTDIFVKNLQSGAISIESQATGGLSEYHSSSPDISSDGRFVVFTSMDNLVAKGDANGAADSDVFWRDRTTGILKLVSGSSDGSVQGSGGGSGSDSDSATVSDDGQWILFQSSSTNLDTTLTDSNGGTDLFLKNMVSGKISNLTAIGWDGMPTNGSSYDGVITPDGRYAVFYSSASNLVSTESYGYSGVFRMDLVTRQVQRVDSTRTGEMVGGGSHPQITPDGRFVVFECAATGLVPAESGGSVGGYGKIYVKDMVTGAVEIASRNETGAVISQYGSYAPQISDDGRYIVFNTQDALTKAETGVFDDVYRVPNPLYSANDEIIASVSYTLPKDVEGLTLAGASGVSLFGRGNELNNRLTSNGNNDMLFGGAGNDTIDGGGGTDTAIFTGTRADHSVTKISNGWTVSSSIDGIDSLSNVERLTFSDSALALDLTGPSSAGGIYRLYGATFNRTPDLAGLGYWISQADKGESAVAMAIDFTYSAEFQALFATKITDNYATGANITNLVTGFYTNVLHRAPDAAGRDWYADQIATHQKTVGQVLAEISDSPENIAQLAGVIVNGVAYIPWTG